MCANYRKYDQKQIYFTVIDTENIREQNPLMTTIDFFVEKHVSIDDFSHKIKNDTGGAPAVHPKMMLKILFYSYAIEVYSSRKIEKRLVWDPNYIYLSGDERLDHSTICNFILKYGEEIKNIFSLLVYIMADFRYVTLDFIAIDGTKIKANASKKFTGSISDFKNKRKRIEEKIEKILMHTLSEDLEIEYKRRMTKKLKILENEKKKIIKFLKEVDEMNVDKNKIISLTDRDACMVKDNDRKYMGYNCQIAVDKNAHVIIGEGVFNTASDYKLLKPMVEEIKKQTNNELHDTDLGVDSGYFSSENLQYCNEHRLNVYLPEGRGEGGIKKRKNKNIQSRDCKLELNENGRRLICPGGQVMETNHPGKDHGNYFYKFYPKKDYCTYCTLKEKCYTNAKRKKFIVKKEYFDTLTIRGKMTEKLMSDKGKQRIINRACVIEHVFGEIKEIFKFRRFMHRTLKKVRVIWSMVCIGYNFRKLSKLDIKKEVVIA